MLDILYQDEWIIAVDKPAGQLVHPADEPKPDDEVTMKILRDQIGQNVETIHRLDRPTTGVLLFGLCRNTAKTLRRFFETQQISKNYLALVHGTPHEQEWSCEEALQKNADSPRKPARTDFKVIQQWGKFTLLEASPRTGRFHQIRRHLQLCEFPIVGDYRYTGIALSEKTTTHIGIGNRMLLQASKIEFPHPITDKQVIIEAPLDPAFKIARDSLCM